MQIDTGAVRRSTVLWLVTGWGLVSAPMSAQWKDQQILQLNGHAKPLALPGRAQLASQEWRRSVQMPYLIHMPEKNELLMLFLSERPTRALLSRSLDGGATWRAPAYMHADASGKPDTPGATSLTYLGTGKAFLTISEGTTDWNWVSDDFGHSWRQTPRPPAFPKQHFIAWDPLYVDGARLIETGYVSIGNWEAGGYSQGVIRFSTDNGMTWSATTMVPQWKGWNEITVTRAKNGDLLAACRSDSPRRFRKLVYDNYSGMGISVSKDDGRTWSEIKPLFDWGHHHPSFVVLPGGEIVITYVVRRGYPASPDGFPQMGVEAVVSRDHGETWDLDHRYILATWKALVKGADAAYIAQVQSSSSVLLPDGSILTSYGGAQRAVRTTPGASDPRDVGLVNWRVNLKTDGLNADRTIAIAPAASDLRNRLDLNRLKGLTVANRGARKNIASKAEGAQVTSSASDLSPDRVLDDDYVSNLLTLQTMPAWVELRWRKPRRIDEIRIHPGAPAISKQPSTECVPLDYRLQYEKSRGQWVDLVPPVQNAPRYRDFDARQRHPDTLEREFEYVHTFAPVKAKAIRLAITRSSDEGRRAVPGAPNKDPGAVAVPEAARETILREIEVFEAPK